MNEKRRGLGRGLGALIPNASQAVRSSRPTDVFFTDSKEGKAADNPRTSRLDEALTTRSSQGLENDALTTALAGGVTKETEPSAPEQPDDQALFPASAAAPGWPGGHVSRETVSPNITSMRGAQNAQTGIASELAPVPGAEFAELDPKQIRVNPKQPRHVFNEEDMAELVHSVREIGVLQPIVVRPVGTDDPAYKDTPYELIMGERRWRATQAAGLDAVPAIIRSTTDEDLLRDALLENLHRSQLNPLEEAAAYAQLLEDFGCTHDQLAERIGRSRPQITNTIRLMKLPPDVQRRVAAGVLSAGHARALLSMSDTDAMERLAKRIVAEGLSVRATEEIIALADDKKPRKKVARQANPELDELASKWADRLDTRVGITMGKNKGKLTVEFASMDDLNRIMDALGIERG